MKHSEYDAHFYMKRASDERNAYRDMHESRMRNRKMESLSPPKRTSPARAVAICLIGVLALVAWDNLWRIWP